MGLSTQHYRVVPVGADESVFTPGALPMSNNKNAQFNVLYYGSMLPLHGIHHVIKAAVELGKINTSVVFTIIGGGKEIQDQVVRANNQGANITYIKRVPLEALRDHIMDCDLGLAGPFGETVQAGMVVTGKTFQFMACAKACVIGKTHVQASFTNQQNCLIVERGSVDSLVQAVNWAYANRRKLRTIGTKGRALYDEQFSTKIIAYELDTIIKAL